MMMKRMAVGGALLVLVAGCGKSASPNAGESKTSTPTTTATSGVSKSPTPSPTTSPSPSVSASPAIPFFKTPEDAGRYLADKWNAKDDVSLHHITNTDSRASLADMRTFATNLKLSKCTKNPGGTYTCEFTHDFLPGKSEPGSVPTDAKHDGPAAKTSAHHGKTALKGVAVSKTGFYFNVFLYCG